MSAALKSISGGKQQPLKPASEDKTIRPHCKISIEDINWVRQQSPCVQQLWLDSVAAEQFGGAAHQLDTNLTYKSFQKAGAALTAEGLFQFEEVFGRLPSRRPGLIGYRVRNLHGYYNRFYWESSTSQELLSCNEKPVHAGEKINHAEGNQNHPGVEQIHADLESFQKNGQKSEDLQGFQNPNNVANYLLTTYQQPTKVVGMVVASDALARISYCGETAHAPLGGASPQTIKSASEEESSPMATNCTTLALVDDAQGQSASLLIENQVSGVEFTNCPEGTSSAAPSLQNLTNTEILNILDAANQGVCPSKEAIASLLKTPHARSLMGAITNNPQWGINLSDYSTVPQSSKLRSQRETKLKSYVAMGECPPDEFLQECLSDPVLAFKVKRMALLKLW
ncbi:MAG: hypothetical protein V7L23_29850 [Nostoc sp.]|uniref:hypothetical protein n=1 Tax=Nostoc sp. TaxID=1180 RepID=UPI002FF2AEAF